MSKRIVILTASVGEGHVAAGAALEDSLRRGAPDVEVERFDVMAWTPWPFRLVYDTGYGTVVTHGPYVYGSMYDAVDREGPRARACRQAVQRAATGGLTARLRRLRADAIIHTHFLPPETIAMDRPDRRPRAKQFVVVTDLLVHSLWVQPGVERFYVASEPAAAVVARRGADADRVRVFGIPIRRQFGEPADRASLRRKHDLPPEAGPVVLLLCGGAGFGPVAALWQELQRLDRPVQLVAVAGRNERLRRRLVEIAADSPHRTRVFGFTDAIHELMATADLAVAKTGGLTTAECLAAGLPLVVVSPVPGQETRNADLLAEWGAAAKIHDLPLLDWTIHRLLDDPACLGRMAAAARAAGRPDAADRIAADVLSQL